MDSRRLAIINTYLTIALIALTTVLIVLTIVLAKDVRRLDALTHSLIGQPPTPPPEQSPTPTPTAEPILKSNTHKLPRLRTRHHHQALNLPERVTDIYAATDSITSSASERQMKPAQLPFNARDSTGLISVVTFTRSISLRTRELPFPVPETQSAFHPRAHETPSRRDARQRSRCSPVSYRELRPTPS